MEYTLKDKLPITKEFLTDLEMKSWQEIEYLQNQIANIEPVEENTKLIQLLKSLLTSYYVFAGGLENFNDCKTIDKVCIDKEPASVIAEPTVETSGYHDEYCEDNNYEPAYVEKQSSATEVDIEPFEYFVDFDDPVGEPLSDEDLYGK